MAATINFSCQLPRQASSGIKLGFPPLKSPSQLALNKMKKREQQTICLRRLADNKSFNSLRLNLVRSSTVEVDFPTGPRFASDLVKEFYDCINEKKLKEIDDYISSDCCFEDCSFIHPLQGKKEVMQFFQQLTAGMGKNVKFSIEHVCQDEEHTAGVNWHLEWKKTQIPFTRGCSFYECAQEGDRLVIKKARVVTESPIKPGGIVLTLLKNLTAFFDDFPKAAEWFLKSPHVILQFLMKFYNRFIAPFVNPIIAGYIRIWKFTAQIFSLALGMLLFIATKYFG